MWSLWLLLLWLLLCVLCMTLGMGSIGLRNSMDATVRVCGVGRGSASMILRVWDRLVELLWMTTLALALMLRLLLDGLFGMVGEVLLCEENTVA